jgi:hypothetical protein
MLYLRNKGVKRGLYIDSTAKRGSASRANNSILEIVRKDPAKEETRLIRQTLTSQTIGSR